MQWLSTDEIHIQNRFTKPAQHRVQADGLPRSVYGRFLLEDIFLFR
jgi:hypothetical protein